MEEIVIVTPKFKVEPCHCVEHVDHCDIGSGHDDNDDDDYQTCDEDDDYVSKYDDNDESKYDDDDDESKYDGDDDSKYDDDYQYEADNDDDDDDDEFELGLYCCGANELITTGHVSFLFSLEHACSDSS